MAITVTVPYAKPPHDDTAAVDFAKQLKVNFDLVGVPNSTHYGDTHKTIVDLETHKGKDTSYARAVRESLKDATLHINLHSFGVDEKWSQDDLSLVSLPYISDQDLYRAANNYLDDYGTITMKDGDYENHYTALMSETLFDVPTVVVYLNEAAVDLYSVFAEALAEFAAGFVDRRIVVGSAQ